MTTIKTLALLLVLVVLGASAAAQQAPAAAAAPANAIGKWDATFNTTNGPVNAQFTLRKDGAKLVGSIASQMGEAPIEAEVKDQTLSVWFSYPGQSGPVPVEMTGTIDGDKAKGSFSYGGSTAGDWLATRAKDASAPVRTETTTPPATTAAPSLTGDWNVTVQLPEITANPALTLKQDGDKLTGDYTSSQYGKFAVTGTVKGTDIVFSFNMTIEGSAVPVTYTGTIEKDGSLKGSVAYGDMMSGTFVATKKK